MLNTFLRVPRCQGVGGPVQVLNAALTGCARAAKWQLCLQLVQSAMSACGTPDVATFGIAISALERGRVFWGRALSLLAESQRGSLNRTSVYNTTISAVGAASRWRMSLHLLQSMRDHAQDPVCVCWRFCCGSCSSSAGRNRTPAASMRVCQCPACSSPTHAGSGFMLGLGLRAGVAMGAVLAGPLGCRVFCRCSKYLGRTASTCLECGDSAL